MPRDSNGVYTLPAGNPVISGAIIESAWANTTMPDLGNEISDSLSRSGEGGMLAPLRKIDGTVGAPSDAWTSEPTSGWYRAGAGDFRFAIAATDVLRMTPGAIEVWNGSTWVGVPLGDFLALDGSSAMTGDLDLGANSIVNLGPGQFGPGGSDLSISVAGDPDTGFASPSAGVIQMVSGGDDFSTAPSIACFPSFANVAAGATQLRLHNSLDPTPEMIRAIVSGIDQFLLSNGVFDALGVLLFKNALDPVDPQDLVTLSYMEANAGTGDFLANGSVPMTGRLTINTAAGSNFINIANALQFVAGAGGQGIYQGGVGSYGSSIEFKTNTDVVIKRGASGGSAIKLISGGQIGFYYNDSTLSALAFSPSSGGLFVNNMLTGGGTERVLTESDGLNLATLIDASSFALGAQLPAYKPLVTPIAKTSDTTYQRVPEFSFLAETGSDYAITGMLLISNSGGGSGGGKFTIDSPITINTAGQVTWSQPGSTNNFSESQNGATLNVAFPAVAPSVGVQVSLNLIVRNNVAGEPAPVDMYFAQYASDPVASTLLEGSYIQIKKLEATTVAPLAWAHNDPPFVSVYDKNDDWTALDDVAEPPPDNARAVAYNNDNSLLAVGHFTSPYLTVYSTLHEYYKLPDVATLPEARVSSLTFSPDGSLLVCALFGAPYIAIYETTGWTRLASPGTLPTGDANKVAFSPNGNYCAVSFAASPYCRVYETATWTSVGTPAGLTANSRGCSFSPDSSMLFVATDAPAARIYSVPALALLQDLTVPSTLRVYNGVWKPDGTELAVGRSSNFTLTIYETTGWTYTEILALSEEVFDLSYSPDGAYLALCQSNGRVYETATYTEQINLLDPPESSYCFGAAWGN